MNMLVTYVSMNHPALLLAQFSRGTGRKSHGASLKFIGCSKHSDPTSLIPHLTFTWSVLKFVSLPFQPIIVHLTLSVFVGAPNLIHKNKHTQTQSESQREKKKNIHKCSNLPTKKDDPPKKILQKKRNKQNLPKNLQLRIYFVLTKKNPAKKGPSSLMKKAPSDEFVHYPRSGTLNGFSASRRSRRSKRSFMPGWRRPEIRR